MAEKVKPIVSGIRVIALRNGYFGHQIKKEGARFMIASANDFGSWMEVHKDDAVKFEASRQKCAVEKKKNELFEKKKSEDKAAELELAAKKKLEEDAKIEAELVKVAEKKLAEEEKAQAEAKKKLDAEAKKAADEAAKREANNLV